jgi:hypothetical protein
MSDMDIKSEIVRLSTLQKAYADSIEEHLSDSKEQLKLIREQTAVLAKHGVILENQGRTLDAQHVSLEKHIHRTELAESAIDYLRIQTTSMLEAMDSIKRRVDPLETASNDRIAVRKFSMSIVKFIAVVSGIAGAIYGLKDLF